MRAFTYSTIEMKVLLINTAIKGGAANACIRLHLGLLQIGVDSRLLCFHGDLDVPQSQPFFPFHQENYLKPIETRSFIAKMIRKVRLLFIKDQEWQDQQERNIQQDLAKTKPSGHEIFSFGVTLYHLHEHPWVQEADVINLHWVNNFLDYSSFFQRVSTPIIWTLHEMYPFTGGCSYSEDCVQFKDGCQLCPQLEGSSNPEYVKHLFKSKLQLLTMPQVEVVAPSQWLLNLSKSSKLLGTRKHHHIPYGLDTSVFKYQERKDVRRQLNWELDGFYVLFTADSIGNRRKGFQYMIDALNQLKDKEMRCVAVGTKPKELYSGIDFQGSVSDVSTMARYYAAADVFVIPTLADNLPNTVLESLLCGTPVIGFPNGGVPEMIEHGKNGLLCQETSALSLAESLLEFRKSYTFDAKQIANDAASKYNFARQAKAYLEVYSDNLENTNN